MDNRTLVMALRRWLLDRVLMGALMGALMGVLVCTPALAHDVPPSFVMLDIGSRVVDVELHLPLGELGLALELPFADDAAAPSAAQRARLERDIAERLTLRAPDGRPYRARLDTMAIKPSAQDPARRSRWLIVNLSFGVPEGATTQSLTLDDTLIVARVPSHEMLVYVRRDLRNGLIGDEPLLLGAAGFGRTQLQIEDAEDGSGSWLGGVLHMARLGMAHIAEGADHMLFLLALLLPCTSLAVRGRWRAGRPVAHSLRSVVGPVTGFTIGHSLSLVLGSLRWVQLPGAAVEAAIALSIVVGALLAWRPLANGRTAWLVATGFGIVHGLAFAEVLDGLAFDTTTWLLSLAGFNLGIEAMQLLLIAAVLPLLVTASATRAGDAVRSAGALLCGAFGLAWLIERVCAWPNPLTAALAGVAAPPLWLMAALGGAGALALAVQAGLWPRALALPASLPLPMSGDPR